MEIDPIEAQLRRTAPTLPLQLRERVLRRCEEAQTPKSEHTRGGSRRWVWALASLCLLHWVTVGMLEAQKDALINGPYLREPQTSTGAVSPDHTRSLAQDRAILNHYRQRSLQLARLLQELQDR